MNMGAAGAHQRKPGAGLAWATHRKTVHRSGEIRREVEMEKNTRDYVGDCPSESIEASPCDTGECDCYMSPLYYVSVCGLEFEETRSPDPAETWKLFLPILDPNGHVKRLMKRALGLIPIGAEEEAAQ